MFQTELTCQRIQEFETQASSDLELRNTKIDELNRVSAFSSEIFCCVTNFSKKPILIFWIYFQTSEELRHQISAQQKQMDQHKAHVAKCIDVVTKLLKEKSNIEKKEARQRCMQNRLRLGQFVTQRVGATFQENWTDGYAFQELARCVGFSLWTCSPIQFKYLRQFINIMYYYRRQEEISSEREEIDKQKKMLLKKRPTNETGRGKRHNSTSQQQAVQQVTATTAVTVNSAVLPTPPVQASGSTSNPATTNTGSTTLHNGTDTATFLKPEALPGFSWQEYYEADEILKLRQSALKKEDADLQLEMEKLERERNLHIRELKRIHNEDQSRFNNHPVLNERYLLLMLLGKGGFSEVHKVSSVLLDTYHYMSEIPIFPSNALLKY